MPNSNIQAFSAAPNMARSADGSYVPVSQPSRNLHGNHQKLLIVIQYYEADRDSAEELGNLIADLERVRNNSADIMFFRRADSPEIGAGVIERLKNKFAKVFSETCRRKDAKGYPFGPNQMWADLVTMFGQGNSWRQNYYAFLPLESDCTPTRPGWIGELIEEFQLAKARGFAAVGHVHDNPVPHLNGVAIYDINLWGIVGGNRLNGSDPQVAYDIFHRENILPLAYNTSKVMMEYQRPTITAADLFKPWKNGFEPAMFHGVKDASARVAVRAKYIVFSEEKDVSARTVFTYEHQKSNSPTAALKYELWKDGWRSNGWNPIKLTIRDAVKHPRYAEVMKTVSKMKFLESGFEPVARLLRWLALDSVGGGLMTDPEVLPNNFHPIQFKRTPGILSTAKQSGILAGCFDSKHLEAYIAALENYKVDEKERLGAAELLVWKTTKLLKKPENSVAVYGEPTWRDSAMISFNQAEMQRIGIAATENQIMEKFLQSSAI